MKNVLFILYFFILILQIKSIDKSDEYYECINPYISVTSPSYCTQILIPETDGYKCCSMKFTYEKDSEYNCFALEQKYAQNKEAIKSYIKTNNISSLFGILGGEIEIDCGNDNVIKETYKKLSDEYLSCSNLSIYNIENENDCTKNDIPKNEGGKCCFFKTEKKYNKIIREEKRCLIISNEFFGYDTHINFTDYLLKETNFHSLNQINDTNVEINCKNNEPFFLKNIKKQKKNFEGWKIALIVIAIVIIIVIIIIIIIYYKKKINNNNINKESKENQ